MSERLTFDNNVVTHDIYHGKYSEVALISMNNSNKNFEYGHSNSIDPITNSRKRKVESLKEHLDYAISSAKPIGSQEDLRDATRDRNWHNTPKDDMNPLRCTSARTVSPFIQVPSDVNKHLKDIINKAILSYGNKKDTSTSLVQSNNAIIRKNSCQEFTPDSVQSSEEIPSIHINREVSPDICIEIHIPEGNERSASFEKCIKSNKRRMNRRDIDTSHCAEIKLSSSCVSHEPKDDRKNDLLEYIPALKLKTSMGMLDSNAQINHYGLFHISQWNALQQLMKCDHSSVKNLYSPFAECQNPYSSIPIFPSHTPKLQASIRREYQAASTAAQTAGLSRNSNDSSPNSCKGVSAISHQELYTPSIISTSDDDHPKEETNTRKHPSILLYNDKDDNMLSPYQCLIRKQIEIFTAERIDVESTAQGRNSPIRLGQVGIRCKHCSKLPPQHRTKASTYYPSKLLGVYQAAQNIAVTHLSGQCPLIPDDIREELIQLHTLNKATPGRGKVYWANSIQLFGLYESDGMIMLDKNKVPST